MDEEIKDAPNRFLDNLTSYGLGHLVDTMADKQDKIIEAVRETGLAGTLTMKLSFKMNGKHQIDVIPIVTEKIPVKPLKIVTMFADEENVLHEDDPNQLNFDNVEKMEDHRNKKVNQV